MPYTVHELKEKLKVACDEITILEVLDISVEDILDRFEDKIEEKIETLSEDFAGDFDEETLSRDGGVANSDSNLERYFEDDGYQIVDRDYFNTWENNNNEDV